MTLGEFIDWIGRDPKYIICFFLLMPVGAALMWFIAKDKGHISPWKYIYSILIYSVCIPVCRPSPSISTFLCFNVRMYLPWIYSPRSCRYCLWS